MDYPTSLDVGDKRVFPPVSLDARAHSGYVRLELTQDVKNLAAVRGRTPDGESGLPIKVLGTVLPGFTGYGFGLLRLPGDADPQPWTRSSGSAWPPPAST